MDNLPTFQETMDFLQEITSHGIFSKIIIILSCIIVFSLASKLLDRIIHDVSVRRALGDLRVLYMTRLMNIGMVFLCIVVMCLVLGLGYSEISVFLSSIFAVVGIALFAQWSILSNVTASMIIFFSFPYKVNDSIKILDKDDDMSGVIIEITLFHVILKRDDGNIITYPNTLILQKAVLRIDKPLAENSANEKHHLRQGELELTASQPEKIKQQY
uniref:mechanosensitive ion channel domain-containing protein n=1 Tax=Cellvibrio fontiphilus TaxID=1815559 RepID=UPI002B4BC45C|nr:mechanosensitive ion channel domain-containing protein [Cellvibrio fontiphilus]